MKVTMCKLYTGMLLARLVQLLLHTNVPSSNSLLAPWWYVLYYIKLVPVGLKNVPFGPNPEWLHTRNLQCKTGLATFILKCHQLQCIRIQGSPLVINGYESWHFTHVVSHCVTGWLTRQHIMTSHNYGCYSTIMNYSNRAGHVLCINVAAY